MNKYIIWDFDNTLAIRNGGWSATLIEIIKRDLPNSLNVTIESISKHLQSGFPWHTPEIINKEISTAEEWWNKIDNVFVNAFMQVCNLDYNKASELSKKVRFEYIKINRFSLFPDTIIVLEYFREKGWKQIVLSNHVPELFDIIDGLCLTKYFYKVYNSAITGIEKPNKQSYLKVLKDIGNYEKIIMVGDSVNADVYGPNSVGIPAILVHNEDIKIKYNAKELSEVIRIIENQ